MKVTDTIPVEIPQSTLDAFPTIGEEEILSNLIDRIEPARRLSGVPVWRRGSLCIEVTYDLFKESPTILKDIEQAAAERGLLLKSPLTSTRAAK